jgi:hypothetical protein
MRGMPSVTFSALTHYMLVWLPPGLFTRRAGHGINSCTPNVGRSGDDMPYNCSNRVPREGRGTNQSVGKGTRLPLDKMCMTWRSVLPEGRGQYLELVGGRNNCMLDDSADGDLWDPENVVTTKHVACRFGFAALPFWRVSQRHGQLKALSAFSWPFEKRSDAMAT